ncbi:MAG: Dabb family protein [Verrucomicrobiota bacterium]
MKPIFLLIATFVVFSLAGLSAETATPPGTLKHVVALKFKPGTEAGEIKKVENAFRDLKQKIPGITSLEWGTNVSPEKHDKGFTHIFVLTFRSEKDRDAYLPHPEHKKFGKILGPVMEDVFVIDFWAKD